MVVLASFLLQVVLGFQKIDMPVVISGTGIYTPHQSIDNKELVESYNKYADSFNEMYKEDISNGTVEALTHSDEEFIKKVSGIENLSLIHI